MSPQQKIAKILGVTEKIIIDFESEISQETGKEGVIERLSAENDRMITETLKKINNDGADASEHVRGALQRAIFYHEKQFSDVLRNVDGADEIEKMVNLSHSVMKPPRGFFLKKELMENILRKRKPENLLNYLGYDSVEKIFKDNDVLEAFSALRFVESNEWMHRTFAEAYSNFTADDFEERDVEIKIFGPKWHGIAKKFVEKKYHNLSHLKEFGVIFVNPIKMDIPGKMLRDFSLLLHYSYEIEFYSRLFKKYSADLDFSEKFKGLLRGDVKWLADINPKKAFLIVQRYLIKEDPNDPRLYHPRVNPESFHWAKSERDLASIKGVDLSMWGNLCWIGGIFRDGREELVSFDLEDNIMSLVSAMEGQKNIFSYHQREAMWTRIFSEYVGGENKLEQLIVENFDKGFISL